MRLNGIDFTLKIWRINVDLKNVHYYLGNLGDEWSSRCQYLRCNVATEVGLLVPETASWKGKGGFGRSASGRVKAMW